MGLILLNLDNPIYSKDSWLELFSQDFPDDALLLFVDAKHAEQFRRVSNLLFNSRFITQFFPWGGHEVISHENLSSEKNFLDDFCC